MKVLGVPLVPREKGGKWGKGVTEVIGSTMGGAPKETDEKGSNFS